MTDQNLIAKRGHTSQHEAGDTSRSTIDLANWWDRVGILVVLIALVALMAAIAPNFASVDNLLKHRSLDLDQRHPGRGSDLRHPHRRDRLVRRLDRRGFRLVAVLTAVAGAPSPLAVLTGVLAGCAAGLINGLLIARRRLDRPNVHR